MEREKHGKTIHFLLALRTRRSCIILMSVLINNTNQINPMQQLIIFHLNMKLGCVNVEQVNRNTSETQILMAGLNIW